MTKPPIIAPDEQGDDFDVERFFELSIEATAEWQKRHVTPRFIERHVEVDRPIALVFTSDWHIGAPGTTHRQLREDMLRIADNDRMYVYLGGDGINNFVIPQLMHAGMAETFAPGDQQVEVFRYTLQPLVESNSVLAAGSGNHDAWTFRTAQLDPRWIMFRDVPYLCTVEGAVMALTVGDYTYRIFRRHRPRWYSVFNPAHCVVAEYQRNPFEFDIGVIEHEHMSHGADFDGKLRDDGSTTRIAIRPGTYKLGDPHADERGYYYASNVQQAVILWPDKFQMLRVRGLDLLTEVLEGI